MNSSERSLPGLAFKPHLRAEVVPGEGVFLVSERGVTALRGAGVSALAPLLDGTRDLNRLINDAARSIPAARTEHVVSGLLAAGLLTERGPDDVTAAADMAFWELAGLDGTAAARRLRHTRVGTVTTGATATAATARQLTDALVAAGLDVLDPAGDPLRSAGRPFGATAPTPLRAADFTVVLCDDYLDPALGGIDAAQRRTGTPWLLVRLGGDRPWIGPVFRPGDGPCWHCLADLLRRNRPAESYLDRALGRRVSPPLSSLAAVRSAGLHLAALESAKWVAGHRHPGQCAIWTVDPLSLSGQHCPVRRRPQCSACGDPDLMRRQVNAPVVLHNRPKAAVEQADRWLSADEMLHRYAHLIDPLTGVVREISRDPRGPEFLNCFHAGHNPATSPNDLASVRFGLRSHSSGKGTTELHARVSALCEAVERHSGYFQGDEPTVRAAYRDVADTAVHPDDVQLFHPRQFAGRTEWNEHNAAAHRVPEPFDEDVRLDWTPVWSLTSRRQRLLPTSLLYYNAPCPRGARTCFANSNGSAAGSCLEDAVVQGTMELIERDAVALWWYNRTPQPGVDLDAFDDPWTRRVRAGHAALHREVWALDLTTDIGVPAFAALSRRVDKAAEDITLGFGAHFDPRIALRRALTELNQMLPPVADVSADGRTGYACDDADALSWWRTATLANAPHLAPRPAAASGWPGGPDAVRRRRDLREDVTVLEQLLAARGLELLVLDQTRPDIGLPVVKVVVPGLRPFWTRFAPGRLYDVPVRLGRLDAPTRYEELNPVPLFM
ncbi:TOMM precursor leader peptide-binding protein [Streptomyces sp. NPDC047315]|uniref:TOMM precursor leader peptide-binding protein n=1 Tax=Streptomyces sp. NPDC047315 TaxID=3155142 RepID=UPI0033D6F4BB